MYTRLNETESALVDFLEACLNTHAAVPSYEEIRCALNLSSKDHVSRLLDRLEKLGYIQREAGRSRSLHLLRTRNGAQFRLGRTVRVPLLAVAPASFDQASHDGFDPDTYIELTRDLVPDEAGIYALQVRGDSMVDAFISSGDIVVLRQQEEARNGDLVQVWVRPDESPTLKRYFHDGHRVCLKPENPTMQPRYYRPEDVQVQGRVVLVIRHMERQLAA